MQALINMLPFSDNIKYIVNRGRRRMQSQDQMRAEKARWQMETQAWRQRSGRISLSNCLALLSPSGIALPLTISRLLSFLFAVHFSASLHDVPVNPASK